MKVNRIIRLRLMQALVFTLFTLPAWGVAQANPTMFGNVAIVAQDNNTYTNLVAAMAHVAIFNNPITAMNRVNNWCGTPSATNPCLVKILPGVYNLDNNSLTMQPFVDIEGSGEDTTIITSATGSSSLVGTVNGASNAEIRSLTVKNTSTSGTYVVALANNAQAPKITQVTAIAAGGGLYCVGVYNISASPTMSFVTATASGGAENNGVLNVSSSPIMSYVTASAANGTFSACGVCNQQSSSPVMSNVTATATNSHFSYGVSNTDSSSPTMSDVRASATGGANDYGVYNMASSPSMRNVTAVGANGTNVFGVENINSAPVMNTVTASASGGSNNFAVSNYGASLTMSNVTATATGSGASALSNTSGSAITIIVDRSTFQGASSSIGNGANVTLKIGASRLIGTVSNSGTISCAASYNGNNLALGTNCQ
jgi:hypothetical protein